ncbi:MAG: zinc-dependent peptidase [Maribacter sp.]|nr:zinc-dependent peptidase [Maribacter sp.]
MCYIIWRLWFKKPDRKFKYISEDWRAILHHKVGYYAKLSPSEKLRFEKEILYFFDATSITGVDLEINDSDRLLVAASAVIPLFGFPELRYRNINEVLLYKDAFNNDNQTDGSNRHTLGKVGSGTMNRLMILSLPALHAGFEQKEDNSNVGIHEFVHLIDKADGVTDGIPESILQHRYVVPWLKAIHREIKSMKHGESDINPYGATSEVEFLSVASEYFFSRPELFKEKHPELYDLMAKMYHQRP